MVPPNAVVPAGKDAPVAAPAQTVPMDLEWRRFCGGLLLGAFENGVARAAISGPHPNGRYALSFYGMDERRELMLARKEKAQAVAERVLRVWAHSRGAAA